MKITEVRTRVLEWKGKTVSLPPHFCTNPMDAVAPMLTNDTMRTWVGTLTRETDDSVVGAVQSPLASHAGQMHNFHIVMASLNSPMAEYFPLVDVEVGNELFWYVFKGEPVAHDGFIDLDENVPGLGLTIDEESLKRFNITE